MLTELEETADWLEARAAALDCELWLNWLVALKPVIQLCRELSAAALPPEQRA